MNAEDCKRIAHSLQQKGVNFLAIDFDYTLVSEHTGGRWLGTAEQLETKVRPLFRQLIPECHNLGITIAIVTFSGQIDIISEVLVRAFPNFGKKIPIRGNAGSWSYVGKGSKDGKQGHMASAAEELIASSGLQITRSSTLLIDDDPKNVNIALNNKVRAVHFRIDNIHETITALDTL